MKALRTLRKWWCELWGPDLYWPAQVDTHRWERGPDLYWPAQVDTHRWENKTEIRRRLSSAH